MTNGGPAPSKQYAKRQPSNSNVSILLVIWTRWTAPSAGSPLLDKLVVSRCGIQESNGVVLLALIITSTTEPGKDRSSSASTLKAIFRGAFLHGLRRRASKSA